MSKPPNQPLEPCLTGEHNFQPRYDEKVPDPFWGAVSNQKDKIYVADVCSRCGTTIKRQE